MSKIILASTSPRRCELLKQAGFLFEIRSPNIDETPKRGENPRALVRRLALAKAQSIVNTLSTDGIVIAADTIVVSPNGKLILGKPVNAVDAKKMLRILSGKTHAVHTAYCILSMNGKSICRVVTSRVDLRKLSPSIISRYVATGEPMDKAGSYAAQGLGIAFIDRIRGSYTNVVGLPMSQLLTDLEQSFGIFPPALSK